MKSSRYLIAIIALISMLFMQLAVAAYACPMMPELNRHAAPISAMPETMTGCAGMDMEQPGLCHAHDQAGNQSLDKPASPLVQPFIATRFTLVLRPLEIVSDTAAIQPASLLLAHATAPPLAIRHCCFRM